MNVFQMCHEKDLTVLEVRLRLQKHLSGPKKVTK